MLHLGRESEAEKKRLVLEESGMQTWVRSGPGLSLMTWMFMMVKARLDIVTIFGQVICTGQCPQYGLTCVSVWTLNDHLARPPGQDQVMVLICLCPPPGTGHDLVGFLRNWWTFSLNRPLGRFSHRVAMSVCTFVCLSRFVHSV